MPEFMYEQGTLTIKSGRRVVKFRIKQPGFRERTWRLYYKGWVLWHHLANSPHYDDWHGVTYEGKEPTPDWTNEQALEWAKPVAEEWVRSHNREPIKFEVDADIAYIAPALRKPDDTKQIEAAVIPVDHGY